VGAAVLSTLVLALTAPPVPAATGDLRAGVGQADMTPQLGYYLGGWTRADRTAGGQHTRLYARALVLQRGGRKVALVAVDLFLVPAGMHQHIAQAVGSRGFTPDNVLVSASHTHSGPGGYANFPSLNTASPSSSTITDPSSFIKLFNPPPADRQLYTFLVRQISTAIRRADADRGPAVAGWGQGELTGITRNRSVEAHLANHGILKAYGRGSAREDPEGEVHTIDPSVDVLRVDKLASRRRCTRRGGRRRCRRRTVRVPIGGWSNFANHGTVTKSSFEFYNGDHHASATRVFAQEVRRAGRVPRRQAVVNVYGNSNEGDQSAGLDHSGPAGSDEVGRAEAGAMIAAWKRAGRRMTRRPALDLRSTRVCFCGQRTEGGVVARDGKVGLPFVTGSEEERGPLFEMTHIVFEDRRGASFGAQGHKIVVPIGSLPPAAPLMVVRVGDRMIATMPGEPTKEVGARMRQRVLEMAGRAGIRRVVIAGLANEYLNYFATPEEYDRQHYEGASTLFGRLTSNFLREHAGILAGRLASGLPAPAPYAYDQTMGVRPDGPAYSRGAPSGRMLGQPPGRVGRFGHAGIAWQGGRLGHDRPVDRAFVSVQRRERGRWRTVDSDLGLAILWQVDPDGRHDAYWEVPRNAPLGEYRLVVTANRYELASRSFRVVAAGSLTVRPVHVGVGRVTVALDYPRAVEDADLTWRPRSAAGGSVRFEVGGRTHTVRARRGQTFSVAVPTGASVRVRAGGGRDRFGNSNRAAVTLVP
jgi:hypothetical protein